MLQVIDTSSCLQAEVLDDEVTLNSDHNTAVLDIVVLCACITDIDVLTQESIVCRLCMSACTWTVIPLTTQILIVSSFSQTVAV